MIFCLGDLSKTRGGPTQIPVERYPGAYLGPNLIWAQKHDIFGIFGIFELNDTFCLPF